MSCLSLNLPAGVSGYSLAVVVAALFVLAKLGRPSKLDAIPTVGSTSWLGSWAAGVKYLTNALDIIQEGYEKHGKAPFKIAAFHCWTVILSKREHLEELRKAPDDELSFSEGINDEIQLEHTLGSAIHYNPYHIPILRSQLTRSMGVVYPQMRNEIATAFDDILDLKGDEWKNVPALGTTQLIICRTSNRVFVGLPLCRDPDWIDLNIQYTMHVVKGAQIIKLFPTFLKPLAARYFTKVIQSNERGKRLLGPIIEERHSYLNEYGKEWTEKPNDLLSWLMDEARGSELSVKALTARILSINFAAVHTSSISFTNALFYLAANPKHVQPLRREVEAIVHKDGWSKASVDKMQKVDSFLKESERIEGFSGVSLIRKAVKDFTFSDGTFVPKGTIAAAATRSIHFDDAVYPSAHEFEPFRFADLGRLEEHGGKEWVKHQFVSTTTEYLAFGHGRHSCPGRFFAATELKSMLAHVVVTYDVKLEDGAARRPRSLFMGTSMMPDPNMKVMFRRRTA